MESCQLPHDKTEIPKDFFKGSRKRKCASYVDVSNSSFLHFVYRGCSKKKNVENSAALDSKMSEIDSRMSENSWIVAISSKAEINCIQSFFRKDPFSDIDFFRTSQKIVTFSESKQKNDELID